MWLVHVAPAVVTLWAAAWTLIATHCPCCRTAGTPGSKSPAGSGAASVSTPEVKTPTAPQNKALQSVKAEHPSVSMTTPRCSEGRGFEFYVVFRFWILCDSDILSE